MLRILFTSNFRNIPIAFILAIFGVFLIEYFSHGYLHKTFFNHEVDAALHRVDTNTFDADYLLIGDSVGRQLLQQFNGDKRYAVLATNQAIETTGQFFFVRRYIENNRKPQAVVFVALPFFYRNLNQNFTENFVLRTFNRTDEILDVFTVTYDPANLAKMFSYKFLPTFKFRLRIQESLVGFTNSDIYSGVDMSKPKQSQSPTSLTSAIHNSLIRKTLPPEKSSYVHFQNMLAYLDEKDIPFWYIPAPQKKSNTPKGTPQYRQHHRMMKSQLPPLKQRFDNFNYSSDLVEHDRKLFMDPAHYNHKGLPVGEAYMRERILAVTAKYENTLSPQK